MNMRRFFKNVAAIVLIPFTRWYLRKKRSYTRGDITVSVLPGVFHPGLFSSTLFILEYIENKISTGQTLLEVGSGSGLISVVAAKANLDVTALDISETATQNTATNARTNGVTIKTVHSDLFTNLDSQRFDWVIINPPYYARTPQSDADHAWYCGENFEYFGKLFRQLPDFVDSQSVTVMVLTQECNLQEIFAIAHSAGCQLALLKEKSSLFDGKDLLYQLHYNI